MKLFIPLFVSHPSTLHTAHTRTVAYYLIHPFQLPVSLIFVLVSSFLIYRHYIRLGNQVLCLLSDKWWHLVGELQVRLHQLDGRDV